LLKEAGKTSVRFAPAAFVLMSVLAGATVAQAEDISGVLTVTKVIVENSQLVVNNLFGGNGSPCAAALCAAPPTAASNNDFGVGLIGTSSNNLVERNSMTGNSNGIPIQAGASGNVIRLNIARASRRSGRPRSPQSQRRRAFSGLRTARWCR
jgi:parallel beta-helix repeat protein